MKRGRLIIAVTLLVTLEGASRAAQQLPTTFRSGVDLVRVAAVVRDHKGRFVQDLTARDFEVLENGRPRSITDFRRDIAGVSIALLFDVSGSMEGHLRDARESAAHTLSWLEPRDEAAVFTFDTHLDEAGPFTPRPTAPPASVTSVAPFRAP